MSNLQIVLISLTFLVAGYLFGSFVNKNKETYLDYNNTTGPRCKSCGSNWPCSSCGSTSAPSCPPVPDMTKYVLKSTVPPCPTLPDMSQYMLKTECPPTPDLSKYVLKSSVPRQQPVFVDTSKTNDMCGECPPCPRPRCPEVKCPPPTKCPPPAPCPRPVCPPQVIKCKAEESVADTVRPFLAPLSSGYASAM